MSHESPLRARLESIPGGVTPTFVASHGHTVTTPALPDDDFAAVLTIAQPELEMGST